jgi:hypothetical protein
MGGTGTWTAILMELSSTGRLGGTEQVDHDHRHNEATSEDATNASGALHPAHLWWYNKRSTRPELVITAWLGSPATAEIVWWSNNKSQVKMQPSSPSVVAQLDSWWQTCKRLICVPFWAHGSLAKILPLTFNRVYTWIWQPWFGFIWIRCPCSVVDFWSPYRPIRGQPLVWLHGHHQLPNALC